MIISLYTAAQWVPKILAERKVKVAFAHQLNDPFELSPKIDAKHYQRLALKHYETPAGKQKAFEVIGVEFGYTNLQRFCEDSWHWIPLLAARVPLNVETARHKFAEEFSQRFRLFFASKVSDSLLMWAHYGKNHTGCVIEFDTSFPFFSELKPILVKYRKRRPEFSYVPGNVKSFEKAIRLVAGTKSPEWRYEKEIRYRVPAPPDGSEFMTFDPAAVHAVIFGCRTSPESKQLISAALANPDYEGVEKLEMNRSKDNYALLRTPCVNL